MNRVISFLSIVGILLTTNGYSQYTSTVTVPSGDLPIITDTLLPNVKWSNEITSEDLFGHLSVIASDAYQGRETGQPGNDMAADYIASQLSSFGLEAKGNEKSYFQQVAFSFSSWEDNAIYINDKRFKHLWDYLAFPSQNQSDPEIKADEVVFLGYGIDEANYSDYKGKDVEGKVIMIYKGEPVDKNGESRITGKSIEGLPDYSMDKKLRMAKEKGVRLVLIIEDELKTILFENRRKLLGPTVELGDQTTKKWDKANHMFISTKIAKEIIGSSSKKYKRIRKCLDKKGKLKELALPVEIVLNFGKKVRVLDGRNVVGYIEGSDKKEEVVIVSAHYDHLGKKGDEIFNGADDNGSGTSTLLELAQSFAMAKANEEGPRRSLLFLWLTGEEKGLLGSEYYVNNPIFPLKNTIVDVNVDMVGRVDKKYTDNPEYVYVIGSDRLSSELHEINETANQKFTQITLDYTYNDEKDSNRYYYRSDHYNFASRGIPAIFYFNGTHKDYHQPTDTIDKINFDKMEKIGRLIFHTIWELANREERITVDGKVQ